MTAGPLFHLSDFVKLEQRIQAEVPGVMAATVCIELKNELGSGTGVLVSPDGLMLSAAHVTGGSRETVQSGSFRWSRVRGRLAWSECRQ